MITSRNLFLILIQKAKYCNVFLVFLGKQRRKNDENVTEYYEI